MRNLLLSLLFACTLSVEGFDGGYHHDITLDAAEIMGFSTDAALFMAGQNVMLDLFSNLPHWNREYCEELHFDNLANVTMVQNYWAQLLANLKRVIKSSISFESGQTMQKDRILAALGFVLHAVQDFGSHSVWGNLNPRKSCDCYSDVTIFEYFATLENEDLYQKFLKTGCFGAMGEKYGCIEGPETKHGSSCEGINKDSTERPLFGEAYTYGAVTSVQVLMFAKHVIVQHTGSVEFWNFLLTYQSPNPTAKEYLVSDVQRSQGFFEYLFLGSSKDGKWKGIGSGNLLKLVSAFLEFVTENMPYSPYVHIFGTTTIQDLTYPHLYEVNKSKVDFTAYNEMIELVKTTRPESQYAMLSVHTTEISVHNKDSDTISDPVYNVINIHGFSYTSAKFREGSSVKNSYQTTLHATSNNVTHLNYAVFLGENQPVSLSPLPNAVSREISVDMKTGVVYYFGEGGAWQTKPANSKEDPLVLRGKPNKHTQEWAEVKLIISVRPILHNCSGRADPATLTGKVFTDAQTRAGFCQNSPLGVQGTPSLCKEEEKDTLNSEFMNYVWALLGTLLGIFLSAVAGTFLLRETFKHLPCVKRGWFREAPINSTFLRLNRCHVKDSRAAFPVVLTRPANGKLFNLTPFWRVLEECPTNVLVTNHNSLLFVPHGYPTPQEEEDPLTLCANSGSRICCRRKPSHLQAGHDEEAVELKALNHKEATKGVAFTLNQITANAQSGLHSNDNHLGTSQEPHEGGVTESSKLKVGWADASGNILRTATVVIKTEHLDPNNRKLKYRSRAWTRMFRIKVWISCLIAVLLFCSVCVIMALGLGKYKICGVGGFAYGERAGPETRCLDEVKLLGLEWSSLVMGISLLYTFLFCICIDEPLSTLILVCARNRKKTNTAGSKFRRCFEGLTYYTEVPKMLIQLLLLGLMLWLCGIVEVTTKGYCDMTDRGCFRCNEDVTAKACRAQALAQFGVDPMCYYDAGVFDDICDSVTGFYGLMLWLDSFFFVIIIAKCVSFVVTVMDRLNGNQESTCLFEVVYPPAKPFGKVVSDAMWSIAHAAEDLLHHGHTDAKHNPNLAQPLLPTGAEEPLQTQ